jgi:hypothetical protein
VTHVEDPRNTRAVLLKDRSPDSVFIEMLTKHGVVDPHVAEDIVGALRRGVAHGLETKYVEVGKKRIELVVSWGRLPHLTTTVTDPPGLVLNVRRRGTTSSRRARRPFLAGRSSFPVRPAADHSYVATHLDRCALHLCHDGSPNLVPSWFQLTGREAVCEQMHVTTSAHSPRQIPRR